MNPNNIDWNVVIDDAHRQINEIDERLIHEPNNRQLLKYRKKVTESLDAAYQMRDKGTYGVFGKMGTALESGSKNMERGSQRISDAGDSVVSKFFLVFLWVFLWPIMLPIWLIKITFFHKRDERRKGVYENTSE